MLILVFTPESLNLENISSTNSG